MIGPVLALLKTLLEVIALARGAEALPRSSALFSLLLIAWVLTGLPFVVLVDGFDQTDLAVGLATGFLGLLLYTGVLQLFGRTARTVQVLTTIVGCGAVLQVMFVAVYVFLTPFVGASLAGLVGWVILLWSIPVEGHVIAGAIDRDRLTGVLIALGIALIQIQVGAMVSPETAASP